MLSVGTQVRVQGMTANPVLNGALGQVTQGPDPGNGRWTVQLTPAIGEWSLIALAPPNMEILYTKTGSEPHGAVDTRPRSEPQIRKEQHGAANMNSSDAYSLPSFLRDTSQMSPDAAAAFERAMRFLETDDDNEAWELLGAGIMIPGQVDPEIGRWWICYMAPALACTCCMLAISSPVYAFCPQSLYSPNIGLAINQEEVGNIAKVNKFCSCYTQKQSMRLEDIEQFYINGYPTACCTTPMDKFSIISKSKSMKIHTTGSVGYNIFGEWEDSREVQSMDTTNRVEVFMLRDYVMAEKAMARAVRLHRTALQREMHSGFGKMAESMMKGAMSPPASVTAPSMTERLGRIDTLTARGALSNVEVSEVRLSLLTCEPDPTLRLIELADLRDKRALTTEEFAALKANVLARAAKSI